MKKFCLTLAFLAPITLFSQFSDNFNDGQFQSREAQPREVEWTGDAEKFVVNEQLQLQLNAPADGSPPAQLRTASTLVANGLWEWWMQLKFTPSSQNYARVYLVSDEQDMTAQLNGLYVRIGYTNRNICLVRSEKDKAGKTLIEGATDRVRLDDVKLHIRATFDQHGIFTLYSRLEGETDFAVEGSCKITESFTGGWFGLACYYTSTRNKHFLFDDFVARELRDDEQSAEEPDPDDDSDDDPDVSPTAKPHDGDVLFSEIMANPGSDGVEWVELYHAGNQAFNLKDCYFYYGDKPYSLPEAVINPGDYFVLTKNNAVASFAGDVRVFGVNSFPALANTGKLLMFGTTDYTLVSWIEYTDKMYGDNTKSSGGWSLECIDLTNLSNTAANWTASATAGGTPGSLNSSADANPDTELPAITSITQLENSAVAIGFSKPMNRLILENLTSYSISGAYGIDGLETNFPQGTQVTIFLTALPPEGELVELSLVGAIDLSGFHLSNPTVMLGSGFSAEEGDALISEIMYNPPTDGDEWVEIYNATDHALDLQFLSIATRKTSDGTLNKAYPLAAKPTLLDAGRYLVITKTRDGVCNFANCREESLFAELAVMPALANSGGDIVILNNKTGNPTDEVPYSDNWHTAGISNTRGISLERADFNQPSDDPSNWHSASADSGYSTPGYENSQQAQSIEEENISIAYPVIDGDNYVIRYQLPNPGFRCTARLFDSSGRLVAKIADNQLLGAQGEIVWNGKSSGNSKVFSGIYIVSMELFEAGGTVKYFRKPVVVK
jgi:hypothetical protein